MGDFPVQLSNYTPPTITTVGLWPELGRYGGGTFGSRAWPASGRALFFPFSIEEPCTVCKGSVVQGNAAGGPNVDMGVYDIKGNRIVSSGGSAQTSLFTVVDFADTLLSPGYYFLAYTAPSGDHYAGNMAVPMLQEKGIREITSGANPLPATATLVTLSSAYFPMLGLHFVGTV